MGGRRHIYGDELALIAQLEIESEDYRKTTVVSDSSWRCRKSSLISSEFYDGETYDPCEEEEEGWNSHTFTKESSWDAVRETEVRHTDLSRTGWLTCSHRMMNKLHENATWSMRGNFPTRSTVPA